MPTRQTYSLNIYDTLISASQFLAICVDSHHVSIVGIFDLISSRAFLITTVILLDFLETH